LVTLEQARALLSQRGWLASHSPDIREAILAIGRLRTYEAGQSIYRAGEPATAVFALVKGGIDVVLPIAEHVPVLAHRADPGFWIGDLATLSGRERLMTMRANTTTIMLVLPGRDIDALLSRQPALYRVFYDMMHANMRLTLTLLADLISFSPVERLARRLALMANRRDEDADPWIDLPQNTLAAMLGMSPATAHRATRRLVDAGLIQTGYGKIRVIDADGLADRAGLS
jgi:CRP-like cAMP-binding protein